MVVVMVAVMVTVVSIFWFTEMWWYGIGVFDGRDGRDGGGGGGFGRRIGYGYIMWIAIDIIIIWLLWVIIIKIDLI